jgi:ribosome assembly protein YihI (activator of Der GTPase)
MGTKININHNIDLQELVNSLSGLEFTELLQIIMERLERQNVTKLEFIANQNRYVIYSLDKIEQLVKS